MVLIVTGFLVESVLPKGECELQRALTMGISLCDVGASDEDIFGRQICEASRRVFIMARDAGKAT